MKQLSLAAFILCVLVACNTATTSTTANDTTAMATDTTAMNENVSYAYPVKYTSDFIIGDPKYAQMVLELWKDFDNNTFDNHKDYFADSVAMDFADGSSINATRDSVVNTAKAYRSSLKNVVSSVEVITTLKPKGKDETWVCVWGKEVDTHNNNNKMDSVNHNENWMFNKDGKIAYMGQYDGKPPHPMKK
jgi:hypothetical protein